MILGTCEIYVNKILKSYIRLKVLLDDLNKKYCLKTVF